MASKGNKIESWEANPWTPAPNANVANEQTMTSTEAQAARAKSKESKSCFAFIAFLRVGMGEHFEFYHKSRDCELTRST